MSVGDENKPIERKKARSISPGPCGFLLLFSLVFFPPSRWSTQNASPRHRDRNEKLTANERKKLFQQIDSPLQLAALRPRSARRSPSRRRRSPPLAATTGPRSPRARPSRRRSPLLPPPRPVSRERETKREKERSGSLVYQEQKERRETSGGQRSCFFFFFPPLPFFLSSSLSLFLNLDTSK